jgi:hypothetical protein
MSRSQQLSARRLSTAIPRTLSQLRQVTHCRACVRVRATARARP